MNNNEQNDQQGNVRFRHALVMIGAATAVICVVALFFFRFDLVIRFVSRFIHILTPFIYGAAIAWLLRPVSRRAEIFLSGLLDPSGSGNRRGLIRALSIAFALLLLLVLLLLLIMAVIPELITSISGLVRQLPGTIERFEAWLNSLDTSVISPEITENLESATETLYDKLQAFLQTDVLPRLETLAAGLLSSFKGIVNVVKDLGLGCIIAAYFLGSWEKFGAQWRLFTHAIFPRKMSDWILRELHLTNEKFSGFIVGKLVDSLIIGIICFIGMSLMRMPYAMLVSIIVGVTNIVPFFGPYLGAIPSAVLILTVSPVKCLIFLVFVILLQQFDGNVLGPKILGDRLGLSSFWILFAILFFGSVWGILGMLIGAPVFAVLYDLLCRMVAVLLKRKGETAMIQEYEKEFPLAVEKPPKEKKKKANKS